VWNFQQLSTDFENSFTVETAINYLQNNYNISRHFLKTFLHYYVKHFNNVAIALPILDVLC